MLIRDMTSIYCFQELRISVESIKREVLNTKGNYAEDFNFLGRFSLIYFQSSISSAFSIFQTFLFCFCF